MSDNFGTGDVFFGFCTINEPLESEKINCKNYDCAFALYNFFLSLSFFVFI